MNGAEKLINAMKKVNESNQPPQSEIVSLTVQSINPLIFELDNRLSITSDFYELSNLENWSTLAVGDIVRAFSYNKGQTYYISEKLPLNPSTNSAEMDKRISTNRNDINTLTNSVTSIQTTIEKVYEGEQAIPNDIYSLNELRIGTWINGKPIYRKVISTGTLPTNIQKTKYINHNINNLDYVIRAWGFGIHSQTSFTIQIPNIDADGSQENLYLFIGTEKIQIDTLIDRSAYTQSWVIIEYTKTTD